MDRPTEPLREEHRELRPHIDEILAVAQALDEQPAATLAPRLDAVSDFLRHHLLRHAAAEEAALYPRVAAALGAPEATDTMSRDHVEIAALSDRLARLAAGVPTGATDVRELRQVLYGLHAIVALHFAKEEEVYLPLLDQRLTPDQAALLFRDLEAAAAAAAR